MVGENADGHNYHRPLLPQTTQMQSFTFAPPTLAPRENQRSMYQSRSAARSEADTTCRLCLRGRAQPAQAPQRLVQHRNFVFGR